MDYKEFFRKLKQDALPNCMLMQGEEEYIKESALAQLRTRYLPQGIQEMNEVVLEGNASQEAIIEACEMLPFMADKRVVVVVDHPMVCAVRGSGDSDKVVAYVADVPQETLLIFYVRGNADGRKKLPSTIKKAGGLVAFAQVGDQELFSFLAREGKARGKTMERAAMERLVFLCGRDLSALVREIEKACAYAQGEQVSPADIDAVAVPTLESNVFQMVDALLDGHEGRAFEIQGMLLRNGESPIMIVAVLTRNLRQLFHAALMLKGGKARPEIEAALGLSGFIAGKITARAQGMDVQWLREMQRACIDADYQIKSGQIKEAAALDLVMLRMMNRAR